ncbi:MAG: hypothetical protein ACPHTD_16180 [Gammaproteobacteria bacterium]|jgi:hypothetical protein
MHKRRFFKNACAAIGLLLFVGTASGDNLVPYSRSAFDALIGSGEPFLLDFFAPW